MSVEADIIAQVKSDMEDITIANSYSFDITTVDEWRYSDLDEETELPAIDIKDPLNEPYEGDEMQHILTVEVTLVDEAGRTAAQHRARVEDLMTAIGLIEGQSYVVGAMWLGGERDSEKAKHRYFKTMVRYGVLYQAERWEM